jgi:hypothetical protein
VRVYINAICLGSGAGFSSGKRAHFTGDAHANAGSIKFSGKTAKMSRHYDIRQWALAIVRSTIEVSPLVDCRRNSKYMSVIPLIIVIEFVRNYH